MLLIMKHLNIKNKKIKKWERKSRMEKKNVKVENQEWGISGQRYACVLTHTPTHTHTQSVQNE